MNEVISFTAEQRADWRAYERVRRGGRFNMFDPRARRATGLSEERYSFVMKNYGKLRSLEGDNK
jgi:hypothetical protein